MLETRAKAFSATNELSKRKVHFFVQSELITVEGPWQYHLQADELFCSEVMIALDTAEAAGTKCLIYPEDLPAVWKAFEDRNTSRAIDLSFRVITSFGELKTITGKGTFAVTVQQGFSQALHQQFAEQYLRQIALQHELEEQGVELDAYQHAEQVSGKGIWYINTQTHAAYYSDGVFQLFGLPAQSLNAHLHTFTPFVHDEERELVTNTIDKAFREQLPLHLEFRIVTPAGDTRYVAYFTRYTYTRRGDPVVLGVYEDISARKEAELKQGEIKEALHLQQQLTAQNEALGRMANWQINLRTRVLVFSDNLYRIFGLRQGSVVNLNLLLDLIHPDDRTAAEKATDELFDNYQPYNLDFRIVRPDGKLRFISLKSKLFPVGDEQLVIGTAHDTTDLVLARKKLDKAEDALQRQQHVLAELEQTTGVGYWQWNLLSGQTTWSPGLEKLFALKNGQTIPSQKAFLEMVHPEDQAHFSAQVSALVSGKEVEEFSFRLIRRGEKKNIRTRLLLEVSDERKLLLAIFRDVTEETGAKENLHRQVQVAELVANASADRIMLTDTNYCILNWNRICEETFGIKKEKAIGRNIFELLPSFNQQELIDSFEQAVKGNKVVLSEQKDTVAKGIFNMSFVPVHNAKEEIAWVLCIFSDVTRDAELRKQLGNRIKFIERLLEASVDRIIVLDRHMNYQYWNKRAEDYYGISKEEVIGKNILELFPSFIDDPSYAMLRQALHGETLHIPALKNLENRKGYFETYLIPIKNERGEAESILWIAHDLSAELKLTRQQQKAAQILNSVNALFIELDDQYRFRFINEEAQRYFNKSSDELLGKLIWDVVPGTLSSSCHSVIVQAKEEGQQKELEFFCFSFQRWMFLSAVPTSDGIILFFYDRQDVKEAQQQLREEHRRLKDAQSIGAIGSFEWNYGDEYVEWSDELYRICHMEPQGERITIGRTERMVWPEDRPAVQAVKEGSFTTPGNYDVKHRIVLDDGTVKWVHHRFESLPDEEGNVVRIYGTLQDITEQKILEDNLQSFREQWGQLLLNTPDIITRWSADFKLISYNDAFIKATGIPDKNPLGKTHEQLGFGKAEAQPFIEDLAEVVHTKQSLLRYMKYETPEGFRHFQSRLFPEFDGQGQVKAIGTITTDISELKATEQQLLKLKEDLAQKATNKYLSLFNSIGQGFSIIEMIFNENGHAIDYRFLEVNPAFKKQSGLDNPVGKTIKELLPGIEDVWIEVYAEVARTGRIKHFEQRAGALDRWYEVHAFPTDAPEEHHIAVLFNDVTERKQAEERQAYLLKLSDAIRDLTSSAEIKQTACQVLGEYLGVSRAMYADSLVQDGVAYFQTSGQYNNDIPLPSLPIPAENYRVGAAPLYSGQASVVKNVVEEIPKDEQEVYLQLNIHSFIGVPLMKNGKPVLIFGVHDNKPRMWSRNEIDLVRETAERTWAAAGRAKAENELRFSEKRFRTLSETLPLIVSLSNAQGSFEYINQWWTEFSGHSPDEFLRGDWINSVHPDDQEVISQSWQNALATGEAYQYEFRALSKTGAYRWLLARGVPLRNEQGEITKWVNTAMDIHDRKEVEERLQGFAAVLEMEVKRRTEDLQKNLMLLQQAEDLAGMGSWGYDYASGKFTWSEGMYELFGLHKGMEVQPEIYLDFATEEDRAVAKRIIKNLKRKPQSFEEELCIKRPDGKRLLKIKATLVNNEEGEPQRMVGIDLDITSIRQAQEKLNESQRLIQQTAAASPDAIKIYNLREEQPLYLNNNLADWLGYSSDELAAMSIEGRLQLVHPDDRSATVQFMEQIGELEDNNTIKIEYRLQRKDGDIIWIRDRSKPFQRDAAGRVAHVLSILQDITEERKAQHQLEELNESLHRQNKTLESKNEEIASFAFVGSHDLKEPLRKLHLMSDWLQEWEHGHLSEKGATYLQRIAKMTRRMQELIDDLVVLTKTNNEEVIFRSVPLHEVAAKAVTELSEEIEEKSARVELSDLGHVQGDQKQLFYLFKNMISNGIKFQAKGSKPLVIVRSELVNGNSVKAEEAERSKKYLRLSFADNGIGIPKHYHKKVFEVFRRLHHTRDYAGTGMGLAICKKVMEKHGGFIEVEDAPGGGTVFHCYFPV